LKQKLFEMVQITVQFFLRNMQNEGGRAKKYAFLSFLFVKLVKSYICPPMIFSFFFLVLISQGG